MRDLIRRAHGAARVAPSDGAPGAATEALNAKGTHVVRRDVSREAYQRALSRVETLVTERVREAGANRRILKHDLENLFMGLRHSEDVALRTAARDIAYRSLQTWETITKNRPR